MYHIQICVFLCTSTIGRCGCICGSISASPCCLQHFFLAPSLLLRLQSTIGSSLTRPWWGTSYWQSGILFLCFTCPFKVTSLFSCFHVYAQGGRGPPQGGQPHTWGSQPEQAKPLWPWRIAWSWKGRHLLSKLKKDQHQLGLLGKLINVVRKQVNESEDEKSIDNWNVLGFQKYISEVQESIMWIWICFWNSSNFMQRSASSSNPCDFHFCDISLSKTPNTVL